MRENRHQKQFVLIAGDVRAQHEDLESISLETLLKTAAHTEKDDLPFAFELGVELVPKTVSGLAPKLCAPLRRFRVFSPSIASL